MSLERKQEVARAGGLAAAGVYGLLFLFGLLQGVTGSFQYSRSVGPVPVAAVCFALAIGLTCVLCGRGLRSTGGALGPAVGWLLASFVLGMSRASGSVVITNTRRRAGVSVRRGAQRRDRGRRRSHKLDAQAGDARTAVWPGVAGT